MKELVFATNNKHKLSEVQALLGNAFRLLSLRDIGCNDDIPEDKFSLEENASQKAFYIYNKYSVDCFADDTGLEIAALNGRPGVFSARYANDMLADNPSLTIAEANMRKVLAEMHGQKNRQARFRCIISLILQGKETQFEGCINGYITTERQGTEGFGYDPVFLPDGHDLTFAQMSLQEKNRISHRALAFAKLKRYLAEKY